jgi:hypothetical protein
MAVSTMATAQARVLMHCRCFDGGRRERSARTGPVRKNREKRGGGPWTKA